MREMLFCEFIDSLEIKSRPLPKSIFDRAKNLMQKAEDARPKMSTETIIDREPPILAGDYTGP